MRLKIWTLVLLWIPVLNTGRLVGQCQNSTQFPAAPVMPSAFSDTVLVTDEQYAGQFYVIEGLSLDETYVFLCSGGGTYLTIRDVYNPATVITHGAPPLTWNVPAGGPDLVAVHVSLLSPPCGVEDPSEATPRTSQLVCTSCPGLPPSVGIGISAPEAVLDVSGEIRVGDVQSLPKAGMIRWNPGSNDFEGFDGAQWKSLTRASARWGEVPSVVGNESANGVANDGQVDDNFGCSVSIDEGYAVAGALFDDVSGNLDQGSAYIFKKSGNAWVQEAKITAQDGAAGDRFGESVSIFGDFVVVGAGLDDIGGNSNQGSAYIFKRTGTMWSQVTKLLASDGAAQDQFGRAVFGYGDQVIVGASGDDAPFADQGSAYIFTRAGNAWTQTAKLVASDGNNGDSFGKSVCLSGDYAIVGSPFDDSPAADQGSAYIFKNTAGTWSQEEKLVASDGETNDYFGTNVGISGDYAILGANGDNVGGNAGQGSAYIFKRSGTTWLEEAKLFASGGAGGDALGSSVFILGDYAIVGLPGDDIDGLSNRGSACVFKRSGTMWPELARLQASDGRADDIMGNSVALSAEYALVGALNHSIGNNPGVGAIYLFVRNE